eukprot:59860-Rhodomonas_salina.4
MSQKTLMVVREQATKQSQVACPPIVLRFLYAESGSDLRAACATRSQSGPVHGHCGNRVPSGTINTGTSSMQVAVFRDGGARMPARSSRGLTAANNSGAMPGVDIST